MIKVGVIGYGYWGPNLVRNFLELSDASVGWVADLRPDRLVPVQARYPTIQVSADPAAVIGDPSVDAVVIATPVRTHFERLTLPQTAPMPQQLCHVRQLQHDGRPHSRRYPDRASAGHAPDVHHGS